MKKINGLKGIKIIFFSAKRLPNENINKGLNKSILVLLFLNTSFWLINMLVGNIILPNTTALPADLKLLLSRLVVQLGRVATAINAPVLYFCR